MFLLLLLLAFVVSDPVSVVTFGICESTFEFHTNFGCDVGIGFDYASFSCGWCIEHISDSWLDWYKTYLTSGVYGWVTYVWDELKRRSSFSCGLFVGIDIGWGFGVSCGYLSAGCAVSTFRVGISCDDEDDDYGPPLHEVCELPILRNYIAYQTADYLVHLKETGVYPHLDVASALQTALDHLDANYEYFYSEQDRDAQLINEAIEFSHTTGCPDIKTGRNIASLWTYLGQTCHGMPVEDLNDLLEEIFPVPGSIFEVEDIICNDNDWTCADHEAFELMDNIIVSQKCALRLGMSQIEARIQEFLEFLGEQAAYEFVPPFVDHYGVDLPSKALSIKSHYLPCVGMDLERVRADISSFVAECYGTDMVDQALDILYWEEDPEVFFEEMKKQLARSPHGDGIFKVKA